MTNEITPQERNAIAWQDLGERIDRATQELGHLDPIGSSERLQDKIVGVEGARAEYERLEATGEPHMSVFIEWLTQHIKSLDNGDHHTQAQRSGYTLILDYTRAY